MTSIENTIPELASTGIAGLDTVLRGGLPRHHLYLLQGESGTGKTTIGMQFLLAGVEAGESAMLIALAESEVDLREIAGSHGWTLEGVELHEVTAAEALQRLNDTQTIFPTAEVELSEVTDAMIAHLRAKKPQRVLFDAITELRLLADHPMRYRRQILALRSALDEIGATALLTDTGLWGEGEEVLNSLVHGILRLERWAPAYGGARRRLDVSKLRGRAYHEGWHDVSVETGGVRVFPRPRRAQSSPNVGWDQLTSGIPELDMLLGGGLEMGTIATFIGSSGTGKSSLSSLFLHAAVKKGLQGAAFLFDERSETLLKRAGDLGVPLQPYVETGQLTVRSIATGELSPGEFTGEMRRVVEDGGANVLLLDSLTGYQMAMPGEELLLNQLHDQLTALNRRGVLSLVTVTNHGLFGGMEQQPVDFSYLSDTVLLMRHFEAEGALRLALSVIKKRHGVHEKTIRELVIRPGGIVLGEPLRHFQGVLTGNPVYHGDKADLIAPQ